MENRMPIDNDLLLVLKSNVLGDGEPDLGEKLIKSFLEQLFESGRLPESIICMNSGVFLTTEGSNVLDVLRKFIGAGTKIFSCGTCLGYYGRADKLEVGEAGNMKESVGSMLEHGKILSP
jgi:selenium metabolism protein YedF